MMDISDMDTIDKVFVGALCVAVAMFVILPILFHSAYMRPTEITGYVIGYETGYDILGIRRTVVTISYDVVSIGTDGEINVHTDERIYAGRGMFKIGKLYTIRSKGSFWWRYTKITQAIILPITGDSD